jgi:hypothetical protein
MLVAAAEAHVLSLPAATRERASDRACERERERARESEKEQARKRESERGTCSDANGIELEREHHISVGLHEPATHSTRGACTFTTLTEN